MRIGDRVVNDVSPKDRDIAMVFQNYALYPHMTVAENIGFALKLRKLPKAEIKKKVTETAELLGLSEWIDRKPGQLSGGQRQRVAMGRAIVREPSVFLMDEPLSNLDAKLRVQMRAEVSRIQRRLGVATLYVTHDQVEAMTMGDRVAVLSGGVLQQCDEPQALYDHPTNLFVAGFMGSPAMNLFEATIAEGADSVLIGSQKIDLPAAVHAASPALRALRQPRRRGRDPSRGPAHLEDRRGVPRRHLGDLRGQRRPRRGPRVRTARPLHVRRPPGRGRGAPRTRTPRVSGKAASPKRAKEWPASTPGRSSPPGAGCNSISTRIGSTSSTSPRARRSPSA